MPQVVIVDEIGTEAEALACRTIAERGVQLIATAHGQLLSNLIKNPTLRCAGADRGKGREVGGQGQGGAGDMRVLWSRSWVLWASCTCVELRYRGPHAHAWS